MDESDEQDCKLLVLQEGYNKMVPPTKASLISEEKERLPVNVSLTLMKVVAIEEVDYSISFKFRISLKWYENRVTFQNLKKDQKYNLLTPNEVKMLWLPLVVYWNTDQEEITRLGVEWEWTTDIWVQKEGDGSRNPITDIEEAEIFQGTENSMTMAQTYTHAFHCVFDLHRYPFDTQVSIHFYPFS